MSDNVETQAESVTHFVEYQEKMEERIISSDGVNTLHQSTTPRDAVTAVGSWDDSADVDPYKARKLMQVELMVPHHDATLLWF